MTSPGSDRDYWEDRAARLGAAAGGYADTAMDAYEDRLRADAIRRLIGRGNGRRLLDAGCGSGRWSIRLADAGWVVTGIDISKSLLAMASPHANVSYHEAAIQDFDAPDESFDAWITVTALQHITDPAQFDAALDNLKRMLRPGGMAGVLEYAPRRVVRATVSYMRPHSRQDWISALTSRGYELRRETGIRFAGHIPYMVTRRAFRDVGLVRSMGWAIDLALARIPVVTRAADVRLLVFHKP